MMEPLDFKPFATKSLRDLLGGPRWLIDENLSHEAADKLSLIGHDAVAVCSRPEMHGMADPLLMQWARDQRRILVTRDKDYGELVFKNLLPAPPGVVIVREAEFVTDVASLLVWLLVEQPVYGNFLSIQPGKGRGRQLPLDKEQRSTLADISNHRPVSRIAPLEIPTVYSHVA